MYTIYYFGYTGLEPVGTADVEEIYDPYAVAYDHMKSAGNIEFADIVTDNGDLMGTVTVHGSTHQYMRRNSWGGDDLWIA